MTTAVTLIARHTVALRVEGARCEFGAGDPLPELPADEAARLVALGAAREAVVEGKPKPAKPGKGPPAAKAGAPAGPPAAGPPAAGPPAAGPPAAGPPAATPGAAAPPA